MITQSATGLVDFVLETDPAIDKDNPKYDRESYERTGDRAHLPLVTGGVPRVFKVRRLNRKQVFRLLSLPLPDQIQEACAFGLVAVEGADVELSRKASDVGERLTDTAMDRLYDLGGVPAMIALGSFILRIGKPDPT